MITKNKIIGFISTLFFVIVALFFAFKVTTEPEFFTFRVMNLWFGYVLLFLAIQGLYIKNGHMNDIKLWHLNIGKYYDTKFWKESNMQMAYFIPLIQDTFLVRYNKSLYKQAFDDYDEEGYSLPLIYKVGSIINKLHLREVFSLMILIGVFVLPRVTNDYDLYRGLNYEQLIMITVGLGISLYNISSSIVNKSIYDILDEYMDVANSKVLSVTLTVVTVFSVFVVVLLGLSVITGIFNIYPSMFKFLFNFELIGVYILISPALLGLQTAILKSQYGRYNIFLNQELR